MSSLEGKEEYFSYNIRIRLYDFINFRVKVCRLK